jgi:ABC-type dipeptide/oligopeptide/nickel transport system permease component
MRVDEPAGSAGEPENEDFEASARASTASKSTWPSDLSRLARGLKHLFAAQFALLGAELSLARSGMVLMLIMGLAAIVFAVALGLTLLALAGWGLAQWFGSWAWALCALAAIQLLFLAGAILVFRRCLHWLTLPGTRAEWAVLMKDAARQGKADSKEGGSP